MYGEEEKCNLTPHCLFNFTGVIYFFISIFFVFFFFCSSPQYYKKNWYNTFTHIHTHTVYYIYRYTYMSWTVFMMYLGKLFGFSFLCAHFHFRPRSLRLCLLIPSAVQFMLCMVSVYGWWILCVYKMTKNRYINVA